MQRVPAGSRRLSTSAHLPLRPARLQSLPTTRPWSGAPRLMSTWGTSSRRCQTSKRPTRLILPTLRPRQEPAPGLVYLSLYLLEADTTSICKILHIWLAHAPRCPTIELRCLARPLMGCLQNVAGGGEEIARHCDRQEARQPAGCQRQHRAQAGRQAAPAALCVHSEALALRLLSLEVHYAIRQFYHSCSGWASGEDNTSARIAEACQETD